jgi:hypothetical protein
MNEEHSPANVDWFRVRLPCLYDLYDRSDKSHPGNYFPYFFASRSEMLIEQILKPWDEILGRLDLKAREQLIKKALNFVTKKATDRGYAQLFNHLNEARGYTLLGDRGYNEISFIDCGDQQSPDLFGKSQNSTAILEVKTINESDKDIDWKEHDRFRTRTVTGLSDGFGLKLRSTIAEARKQLDAYPKPVDKKIALLLIRFDTDNILEARNHTALQNLIEANQIDGMEVVHDVI